MKYNLKQAKKKIDALDKRRIERALQGSSEAYQHIVSLITLFLHCNHSQLPGFVQDSPTGIANFQLSRYQQNYLATTHPHLLPQLQDLKPNQQAPLLGVYAMGSFSSISQTYSSDLDAWLCYRSDLSESELELLQQKITAIEQWANQFKVEIHFYLMDQQRFQKKQQLDSITAENCGSAQYMLLLDEFYRSAVRLAGLPLLWLHLMVEEENNYEQEVARLIAEKQIDPQDWVDFGGLGQFSANEYFGASLWQLYKGINSPYKSVLKISLLEAYAKEYPNTKLISTEFKQDLLQGESVPYHHFDPYIAMLARVSRSLQAAGEFKRLNFVRSAFYIKATEDLALYQADNWRLDYVKMLAQDWNWPAEKIQDLNNRPLWQIKQVEKNHKSLVKFLILSYRNLVNFAHKHRINPSVMPEDIDILTRNLYSTFEKFPTKVALLNAHISQNLAEPHLTFVEVKGNNKIKNGWYMVNLSRNQLSNYPKRFTQYAETLSKLVAWAYFNRLLVEETVLHLISSNVSLATLRQFVADLRLAFPLIKHKFSHTRLSCPSEIHHLLIAINLTKDPTEHLEGNKNALVARDLFSFGPVQQSLVGSIDFIYRNAWNEIRTLHFEGQIAILLALKVLSNKIYLGSSSPKSVQVFCYSQYYRNSLRNLVSALVQRCISIQVDNKQPTMNKLLRVAGKNWQFFFEEKGISVQEVQNENPDAVEFAEVLQQCAEEKPPRFNDYPVEIDAFASEGFLQFFFADNSNGSFDVYVLNEANQMEIYRQCEGSKQQKVQQINQIYQSSGLEGNENPYKIVQRDFNYPQFYQLLKNSKGNIQIVPFHRSLIVSA